MNAETQLASLRIKNFRGIEDLAVHQLPPVCLITGPQGSGKSAVLDAVETCASRGSAVTIRSVLMRAGETIPWGKGHIPDRNALFHQEDTRRTILISGGNAETDIRIRLEPEDDETPTLTVRSSTAVNMWRRISLEPGPEMRWLDAHLPEGHPFRPWDCIRIGPEAPGDEAIAPLHDRLFMNGNEEEFAEELAEVTGLPILRLACIQDSPHRKLICRTAGSRAPVPLRRLGEGAANAAAVMLALDDARDGIILLDQPETGLHIDTVRRLGEHIARRVPERNTQAFIATDSPVLASALEGAATIIDLGPETP